MTASTVAMLTLGLTAGGLGLLIAILAALADEIELAGALIAIFLFVALALLGGVIYNQSHQEDGREKLLPPPAMTCPLEHV